MHRVIRYALLLILLADWLAAERANRPRHQSISPGPGVRQRSDSGAAALSSPTFHQGTDPAILQVRHDHDPWGQCKGELEISDSGIEFRSKKKKHSRQWDWLDIQSFDRLSDTRFSILTWHDQKWKLGLDRSFDFTVLPDSSPLSPTDFERIRAQIEGTVTDRLARDIQTEYSVPVKHLHTLGGCEGILKFGADWIVYQTGHAKDSRSWRRDREVESVWSLHRYQLEIHVFEENQRDFDKSRRFRFQLKRPLDPEYYAKLRRELLPAR